MEYGCSCSSDTIPASWPPHSFVRTKISFASTSSFICVSPWTLTVPASPRAFASAPLPISVAMRLHARRTSLTRAVKLTVGSPAPAAASSSRCSSMRNRVMVPVLNILLVVMLAAPSVLLLPEYATRPDIRLLYGLQVLPGDRSVLFDAMALEQPAGLPQARPIERVADRPRIREVRLRAPLLDVFLQRRGGLRAHAILHLLQHQLRDREQFLGRVVGKVDVMRDARGHAGVAAEERLHPVPVAGQDDDQVVTLVLHDLQQDLDRLLAIVALVLRTVEVVRLVDEEHPT